MTLFILMVAGLGILAHQKGKKKPAPWQHGTARWATVADMQQAGLLDDGPGLGIGVVKDGKATRKVRLNRAVHVLVTAPSGSGKGTSIIIPFLRSCRESVVVHDPKGENWRLVKDHLAAAGVRVVRLDPFGICGPGADTLNPLDSIDPNSIGMLDDVKALSSEIVTRPGMEQDPFFLDSTEGAGTGAVGITCTLPMGHPNRTLPDARSLLSGTEQFQRLVAALKSEPSHGGMLKIIGHSLGSHKDKQLSGVLSTCTTKWSFMDSVPIAESLRRSSFDAKEIVTGKVAVFVILPPDKLVSHAGWLRLVVGTFLRTCINAGLSNSETVTFVLDEYSSIGQMNSIESALAIGRGYRIRLQLYVQSLSQLKLTQREGQDQTILGNTSQVFFGCNDPITAEQISGRLGDETIWVDSFGSSSGSSNTLNESGQPGSYGDTRGRNVTRSLMARRLMKMEELMTLPPSYCISFPPGGCPPVASWLVPYYAETVAKTGSKAKSLLREAAIAATVFGTTAAVIGALWLAGI